MDINDLFDGIADAFRQYQEETEMSVSGLEESVDAKIQRTEKQMSEEIEVNRPSGGDWPEGKSG
ncbi:hypothetical protein PDESU_06104 [Pontiella desulfatans]|uniref:Uncharacterized protein n=1 Tax=Pontiella desulfatans TaxID=2750659 RepID=A0A6C2UBI0_PONDE|nr:hypothetical protein [Pontiella desulfatans]VGO17508.1 hypothetical protein PDESU_06104 [Pontiella desulfatans]